MLLLSSHKSNWSEQTCRLNFNRWPLSMGINIMFGMLLYIPNEFVDLLLGPPPSSLSSPTPPPPPPSPSSLPSLTSQPHTHMNSESHLMWSCETSSFTYVNPWIFRLFLCGPILCRFKRQPFFHSTDLHISGTETFWGAHRTKIPSITRSVAHIDINTYTQQTHVI